MRKSKYIRDECFHRRDALLNVVQRGHARVSNSLHLSPLFVYIVRGGGGGGVAALSALLRGVARNG